METVEPEDDHRHVARATDIVDSTSVVLTASRNGTYPSSVPTASSPEACALAGYPPSARAQVVGSHTNGDFAAVYVLTDEGADWLSVVQRDEGGWTEVGGGDGGSLWVDTDDDADDRGVLACVIPVDAPGTTWCATRTARPASGPQSRMS